MLVQLLRLALADLRRDWALSLCQVFTLAAVLTPLLVLFGIQQGVLGQLIDELRRNPVMREIGPRVTGTNRFTARWLSDVGARADVAFVVGDARFNAATVEASSATAPNGAPVMATLVPTAAGDPLRSAGPWADDGDHIVLSSDAARALAATPGTAISMLIPRVRNGTSENRILTLSVAAILPESLMSGRRAILADARLVLDVQHYRDGLAVAELGWTGDPMPPDAPHYERFRLYARSIDDVTPLVAWLRAQGVEPVSHIEEIAPVQILNHGLSIVLLIVSAFATGGLAVAIAATQWNAVRRKRRELALLALVGYGKAWLLAIPVLQGLLLSVLGIALSIALFELAGATIDFVFVQWHKLSSPACQLGIGWFAATGTAALGLSLLASAIAAAQIIRIEPAASIRDD